MSIKPVARGVTVCEYVIIEEGTQNVSSVNCFTRRLVSRFPSAPQSFAVFALLTGGQGSVQLVVRLSRGDTLEPLLARLVGLVFEGPLQEVRFIYRFRDCVFPVAGQYQLELLADGELIALTTFSVTQRE